MNDRQYSFFVWLIFSVIAYICGYLTVMISVLFAIPMILALICCWFIPEDEKELRWK